MTDTTQGGSAPVGAPDSTGIGQNAPASTPSTSPSPEAPAPAPASLPGVPEKYEFKSPDGVEAYPQAALDAFSTVARHIGLTQEAAQTTLDKMFPELVGQLTPLFEAQEKARIEAEQQQRKEWADASRADKEFGGDKLTENLGIAKRAAMQFGGQELLDLLDTSGLGNHPAMLRALYRAGQAISEDGFIPGQTGSRAPTIEERMYPNEAKRRA